MSKRCRHYRSWIIGAVWEWCPECGAIRRHKLLAPNTLQPETEWTKPVGEGGANPCSMKKLKPRNP